MSEQRLTFRSAISEDAVALRQLDGGSIVTVGDTVTVTVEPPAVLSMNVGDFYATAQIVYDTVATLAAIDGAVNFCGWLRDILKKRKNNQAGAEPIRRVSPTRPLFLVEYGNRWYAIRTPRDIDDLEAMLREHSDRPNR